MENIEKLKETLSNIVDYLILNKNGEFAKSLLEEVEDAQTIVENLSLCVVVKSLPSKESLNIKIDSEIERWKFDDYMQKETYKVGFRDCHSWIEKMMIK